MIRQFALAAVLAVSLIAVDAAPVDAWAARHVGYTHVGPTGVYHAGRTSVATPYGARTTGGVSHAGYGGYDRARYGAGVGYGGAYHYGGYRAPGVSYGAGVYRRY